MSAEDATVDPVDMGTVEADIGKSRDALRTDDEAVSRFLLYAFHCDINKSEMCIYNIMFIPN